MSDTLQQLCAIIEERRRASPDDSYVASLHHKGLNRILEKVGEEATEVVLAAKDAALQGDRQALAEEVADLWFHTLVMLSHLDMGVDQVLDCLAGRLGVSGLQEKAARGADNQ